MLSISHFLIGQAPTSQRLNSPGPKLNHSRMHPEVKVINQASRVPADHMKPSSVFPNCVRHSGRTFTSREALLTSRDAQ
jgi:hypothetical protein